MNTAIATKTHALIHQTSNAAGSIKSYQLKPKQEQSSINTAGQSQKEEDFNTRAKQKSSLKT